MQFQKRFLETIVGFRSTRREAHAETIEPRREQTVQLLEDAVLAPSVALHQ
jgi:hypothetical protein